MAGNDQSAEDRSETATTKHLEQARDDGRTPVSREVVTFAALAAAAIVWALQPPVVIQHLLPQMISLLAGAGRSNSLGSSQLLDVFYEVVRVILPGLLASVLIGAASVLLQTRFLIHLSGIQPKVSRVNPIAGLKRVFGFNGIVEIIKSLAKFGFVSMAVWIAIKNDWHRVARLMREDPAGLIVELGAPVHHLFTSVMCVQGIIAASDLAWVRFRHSQDMRMSKQDIRDESKDTEGNPHTKARIRGIQMMRARKRMMTKVPTSTVVITNPTHYAVALAYDRANSPAPRIVAKGYDSVAARIREIAQASGVPIISNPPLARALYAFKLDTEIPAEYYRAVAEIIAYVWRLRRSVQVGQQAVGNTNTQAGS